MFRQAVFTVLIFVMFGCKQENNYITYYNKMYEADSVMRYQNDTIKALKKYKKLFRKYTPKNDERINEFTNYILISDKLGRNFGGKKSLQHYIKLSAVNWQNVGENPDFKRLFQKYGLDSMAVNDGVRKWKTGLNQPLIDSFRIALKRDHDGRPENLTLVKKNVNTNASLLKWTLDNFGYPTNDKIGWFPRPTFLTHMIESEKYQYFKQELPKYIKSGDLYPRDYAMLVDYGLELTDKKNYTYYGTNDGHIKITDSTEVNRHRKSIGLPSLKHNALIRKQTLQKKSSN